MKRECCLEMPFQLSLEGLWPKKRLEQGRSFSGGRMLVGLTAGRALPKSFSPAHAVILKGRS